MAAMVLRSLSSSAAAARRMLFLSRSSFSSLITPQRSIVSPETSRFFSMIPPISGCSTSTMTFRHSFSTDVSHVPAITDPSVEAAFKDLMAMSWDEIPDSVVSVVKKALAKTTDDKAGQEALSNVFRAAEAGVEFGGVLVSLRMALDDLSGLTGENVGPLPGVLEDAMKAAYKRYMAYLDSFGPDEAYLRKKVETELGTKMIHLKMRCSGIGSEWGKIHLKRKFKAKENECSNKCGVQSQVAIILKEERASTRGRSYLLTRDMESDQQWTTKENPILANDFLWMGVKEWYLEEEVDSSQRMCKACHLIFHYFGVRV